MVLVLADEQLKRMRFKTETWELEPEKDSIEGLWIVKLEPFKCLHYPLGTQLKQ